MRACWIDEGTDPDTRLLDTHGVTRLYFAARDPRVTAPYLYGPDGHVGWRADYEVGIYRVPEWDGYDESDLAHRLDLDIAAFGGNGRQLAVHVNAESHAFNLVEFLTIWRQLRPNRQTGWVIEGLQGGRLTPAQVKAINLDVNLTVWAENYTGGMVDFDADAARSNLVNYQVARGRALVMYDAAHLPAYWDGCAFTQDRLPW